MVGCKAITVSLEVIEPSKAGIRRGFPALHRKLVIINAADLH